MRSFERAARILERLNRAGALSWCINTSADFGPLAEYDGRSISVSGHFLSRFNMDCFEAGFATGWELHRALL
jgi:hypothetical protein